MTIFAVPENLAFDTYAQLSDAIADWMNRSDLTGSIPTMIALAEARMKRALLPLMLETSVSLTADANGVVTLPSDYGTLVRVRYNGKRDLPQYSDALELSNAAEPHAYSLEGGALVIWPNSASVVTLTYRTKFPNLSEAYPQNDFLAQHPDMYFFGSMLFAEGYVANDARAALFKGLFDEALAEVKNYLTRQQFAGRLQPRLNVFP